MALREARKTVFTPPPHRGLERGVEDCVPPTPHRGLERGEEDGVPSPPLTVALSEARKTVCGKSKKASTVKRQTSSLPTANTPVTIRYKILHEGGGGHMFTVMIRYKIMYGEGGGMEAEPWATPWAKPHATLWAKPWAKPALSAPGNPACNPSSKPSQLTPS